MAFISALTAIWDVLVSNWVWLLFALLVVLPLGLHLPTLPDRIRDIRTGIRGVVYVPICVVVLFTSAFAATMAAEYIPLLQWGWLGENIIVSPITPDSTGEGGGSGGSVLELAVFVPVIVVAMVLFNYYEERLYRDSYRAVVIWAILHLIMGIPLFAVIPIFAVGVIYKVLYDYRSLEVAYVAHLFTNFVLLTLLVISSLLLH